VPTCRLDERVGDVRERVRAAGWDASVAVNQDRVVFGLLRSIELDAAGETSIEAAMRPGPSTFRPFVSIEYMAKYMIEHELDSSPVTTPDGRLIGLLMRQDVERVARDLSQKKGLEAPGS